MRSTSVAPGATIDLIVSAGTQIKDGIRIAAEYAVDTNPIPAQIMNISFGACEADAGQPGVQFWDSLFSQAAGEGISVFVASGDAGVAGCDTYFADSATKPDPQYQLHLRFELLDLRGWNGVCRYGGSRPILEPEPGAGPSV